MSLAIYLNDDFQGGETIFYIPKQHDFTRDLNISDVVDQDRFDPITLKPSTGLADIFSQNIIHESVMIQSSVKCILKTDIILKRIQPLGFQVSDVERRFFKMFELVSNCAIARIKERFM